MSDDFPELPEDNLAAFMKMEAEFRQKFEALSLESERNWQYDAADYMNKTLAAAIELGLDALSHHEAVSHDSSNFSSSFSNFLRDVDHILVRIRIQGSRRQRGNSVGLTEEQKTRIHALIEGIRQAIEKSSAEMAKKERLFNILADLAKEVSKPRTALARFGDLARGLAGIGKDVAEEAEPMWKWARLIFGEVDEAKEKEPQLPKPEEIKRIEPPRKELPKPDGSNFEDDIPF